jgi:hypothetical protein
MRFILAGPLLAVIALAGCGGDRGAGWGTFPAEDKGDVRVITPQVDAGEAPVSYTMPNVRHIVDATREQILARSAIIFFYDPNSKFGDLIFKHRGRWYLCGGFIGNVSEFIHEEAKIHGGVVVFVTPGDSSFNQAGTGPVIAHSLTRGKPDDWDFYYIDSEKFGQPPEFRHYYDTDNKKITYRDY